MTYASQKLAEALQQLAREVDRPQDYTKCELPTSIETKEVQFPAAVAEFLQKTSHYTAQTKNVSVGIY